MGYTIALKRPVGAIAGPEAQAVLRQVVAGQDVVLAEEAGQEDPGGLDGGLADLAAELLLPLEDQDAAAGSGALDLDGGGGAGERAADDHHVMMM